MSLENKILAIIILLAGISLMVILGYTLTHTNGELGSKLCYNYLTSGDPRLEEIDPTIEIEDFICTNVNTGETVYLKWREYTSDKQGEGK